MHKYSKALSVLLIAIAGNLPLSAQDTIGVNAIKEYTLQKFPRYDRFNDNDYWKRLFMQLQFGGSTYIDRGMQLDKNSAYDAGIAAGYWVTPLHGFRTGATFHLYEEIENGKSVSWRTDYLLNLSALCLGYDRDRTFELVGALGAEYVYSRYQKETHHDIGLKMGLQGRVKASQYTVFYLEPSVGLYTEHFRPGVSWRRYDVGATLTAGLEYRPSPVEERNQDEFLDKNWADHLFLYAGAGGGFRIKRSGDIRDNLGGSVMLGVGKWFNPYSGARVNGKWSIFRNTPHQRYEAIGAQADYLLNFSNLLSGYRADRDYYVYIPLGFNIDFTNAKEVSSPKWAFGFGMQAAFKLNSNVEYFIEPRFNLYTFNQAVGYTILDSDLNFLLSTGFNFIRVPESMMAYRERLKEYRKQYSERKLNNKALREELKKESDLKLKQEKSKRVYSQWRALDHIFVGAGIDAGIPLKSTRFYQEKINPKGAAWAGLWFSPYLGLRGYTEVGYSYRSEQKPRVKSADFGVDALWNFSNSMFGRNDSRKFDLIAGAGLNVLFFTSDFKPSYLGGSLSLQGQYHVTDHVALFLEPRLRLYPDALAEGKLPFLGCDAVLSGLAGINVYFPARKSWENARNSKGDARRFTSLSAGGQFIVQNPSGIGPVGEFMLGRWKNELHGWRAGFISEYRTENNNKYAFGGVGADYLMDLSTLMYGPNPFRKTRVIGLGGVQLGVDPKKGELRLGVGARLGGQVSYALSSNLSVNVQPTLTFRSIAREDSETKNTLLPGFQLGMSYGLKQSNRHSDPMGQGNYFASASYGLGLYSETVRMEGKVLHSVVRASAGKWLSPVSGIRGNLTWRNPESKRGNARIQSIGVGADYLLNLSSWMAGENADRKVDVIPNIGLELDFNSLKKYDSSTTLGARAGAMVNYHASKQIDVFVEPSLHVLPNSFDKSQGRVVKALAELELGIQYKF